MTIRVLEVYQLNTVTYGTFAQACETILNCFYVDDLLFGGQDVNEVIRLKNGISNILPTGGFELRKWVPNDQRAVGVDDDTNTPTQLKFETSESTRTLGSKWIPRGDTINYEIEASFIERPITKRSILSSTSQLFDPLRLLNCE